MVGKNGGVGVRGRAGLWLWLMAMIKSRALIKGCRGPQAQSFQEQEAALEEGGGKWLVGS